MTGGYDDMEISVFTLSSGERAVGCPKTPGGRQAGRPPGGLNGLNLKSCGGKPLYSNLGHLKNIHKGEHCQGNATRH